jgi:DnaJ like chaperone protein
MAWFGKLTFGTLGLFFGGPLGAIAGAALGHHLIDRRADSLDHAIDPRQRPRLRDAERTQAAYFISLFSILGKLSKIDGVVTTHEIALTENFINSLHVADSEKQFAREIFDQAKNSPYSIEDFAIQFHQTTRQQPAVLYSFFDLLFQIAAADGTLHPSEESALRRIKDIFQLSDEQFNNAKSVHFKALDRYYKILNCRPESTDDEIRSRYKELVKDFHPDKIISKGLPQEFTDFATQRFREIQEAYEKIKQERQP